MIDDRESYAPLVLFEYDHQPGNYCVLLSDSHMVKVDAAFQEAGYEGHGYDWNGVALQAAREIGVAGRFDTDPEAGMFVAYGADLEALKALGAALAAAFHDPARLRALIAAGDPSEFD
jgi:hypothetical protein